MQSRVRAAAALVAIGLLIQLLALRRADPPSFLAFVLVGIPVVAAGVLLFLYSLVSVRE